MIPENSPLPTIVVFSTSNQTIIFEPKRWLPSGFIESKKWLNSSTLQSGRFPERIFNPCFCRGTTKEEAEEYIVLKDHSQYALNAD